MKCPSCKRTLSAGAERCAGCGAVVAPPLQGSLAPVPQAVTPPPRKKVEPLRDIPGLPKKERTWRDEVQERVARRRKKRAQSRLPLFEQPAVADPPVDAVREAPAAPRATVDPPPVVEPPSPAVEEPARAEPAPTPTAGGATGVPMDPALTEPEGAEFEAAPLTEEELADLPLRQLEPPAVARFDAEAPPIPRVDVDLSGVADTPGLDEPLPTMDEDEEAVALSPPPAEPAPLERPARIGERAQAAALDAGILVVLGVLVVYFTGRAARADIVSLGASWPWLVSYLAFLGLFYAGYFTGTTGQTPGKMMTRLRVVDTRGRPPGYLRAAWRAAVGALGTGLVGLGLVPMALDPARRALHDRLASTRVVHR